MPSRCRRGALALAACASFATLAAADELDSWRSMSVYQVLTDRFARADGLNATCDLQAREYCGGNWRGIESQLDYIQGMGFNTVWISPVVENTEGGYHGYYGKDLRKLNDHFGTADDLKSLSSALHARGMLLMLDVFAQHVAVPPHLATEGFVPPPGYGAFSSPDDYHPFCWIRDYENATECEQCWLGEGGPAALADLNTEKTSVVAELYDWVGSLVKDYGVDALRLDTVKHVRKSFWPGFQRAAGVLAMGEVLHGDPAFVGPYQGAALSSVLNYPTYFPLVRAFSSTTSNMYELRDMILRLQDSAADMSLWGTFLENHDQKRFGHSVKDESLKKNAVAFTFVADGFPIVYSGFEHGLSSGDDPLNREAIWQHGYDRSLPMYRFLADLNSLRQLAIASSSAFLAGETVPLHVDAHELVLLRGNLLTFLSNRGSKQRGGAVVKVNVPGLKRGDVLVQVFSGAGAASGPQQQVVVGKEGSVRVIIRQGLPQAYIPLKVLRRRPTNIDITAAQAIGVADSETLSEPRSPLSPTSWRRRIAVGLGMAGLAFLAANKQSRTTP